MGAFTNKASVSKLKVFRCRTHFVNTATNSYYIFLISYIYVRLRPSIYIVKYLFSQVLKFICRSIDPSYVRVKVSPQNLLQVKCQSFVFDAMPTTFICDFFYSFSFPVDYALNEEVSNTWFHEYE